LAANDTRKEGASNIEKARQLRAAGKFTESIKILENEVSRKPGGQSSPELAECWLNMALNYWNLGEITRAENAFIFVQALADKKGEEALRKVRQTSAWRLSGYIGRLNSNVRRKSIRKQRHYFFQVSIWPKNTI